jgi:hypothetical protein
VVMVCAAVFSIGLRITADRSSSSAKASRTMPDDVECIGSSSPVQLRPWI